MTADELEELADALSDEFSGGLYWPEASHAVEALHHLVWTIRKDTA